jgi:hypothetical protein
VIAPYDEDMARLWENLKAQARRAGHALGAAEQTNDLWICRLRLSDLPASLCRAKTHK